MWYVDSAQADLWLTVLFKVAERAKPVWAKKHAHLMSRTTFVGGSFFDKGLSSLMLASRLVSRLWTKYFAYLLMSLCGACADSLPKAVSSKDVYVMRSVLHDWTDNQSKNILRHVRAAIGVLLQPWLPE